MDQQQTQKPKKLRTACDVCHQAKMKCSGGRPCDGCRDSGYDCSYSVSNRIGRPKGTKNKRTIERLNRQNAEIEKEQSSQFQMSNPITMPSQASSSLGSPISTTPTFSDDLSIQTMLDTNPDFSYSLSQSFQPEHGSMPYNDPVGEWCNLDGLAGIPDPADPAHPMKVPSGHHQPPYIKGDMSLSPPFDASTHWPGAISQPSSYSGTAYMSPSVSSRRSSDRDTSLTIPSELSRYQSTDSGVSSASSACRCLEHHADLICRLKELEQKHIIPRIDVVLVGAQQALVPWKNVIECRTCRSDDNQEVLLLSAISIRSVLRRLQSLLIESRNQMPLSDTSSPGSAFSPTFSGQTSPVLSNYSSSHDDIKSTIGIYEITGEERTAVTDLLVSRTLDRIRYTLVRFKERIDSLKGKRTVHPAATRNAMSMYHQNGVGDDIAEDYCANKGGKGIGDLEHLEQVWHNLENTVQKLVRAIRSSSTTSM